MPLTCKWKTECGYCGDTIEEGDRIILTSEKEKMCSDCAYDRGYICDCGNDKKPEYDTCWDCRPAPQPGTRCACGRYKKPQYPTCYTCKQQLAH